MWDHPLTSRQLSELQIMGYRVIPPVRKVLVCGDMGMGAMASIPNIVKSLLEAVVRKK